MKKVLTGIAAAVSFVVILILAFENVQASCNYLTFFFWELSASTAPTFTLFGASLVGMFTGVMGAMFYHSVTNVDPEEENPDEDFQV